MMSQASQNYIYLVLSGPGGNGAVCEKNKDCRTGYCGAESGTCTFCGTDEDCGKKKYCSVYYGDANRRVCVTGSKFLFL